MELPDLPPWLDEPSQPYEELPVDELAAVYDE